MDLLNSALNVMIEGLLFVVLLYGALGLLLQLLIVDTKKTPTAPTDVASSEETTIVKGKDTADLIANLREELAQTKAMLSTAQADLQNMRQMLEQHQVERQAMPMVVSAAEPTSVVIQDPWDADDTEVDVEEEQSIATTQSSLPQIARDVLKIWTRKGKKVVKEATIPLDVPESIQRLRFRKTAVIRLSDLEAIAILT